MVVGFLGDVLSGLSFFVNYIDGKHKEKVKRHDSMAPKTPGEKDSQVREVVNETK